MLVFECFSNEDIATYRQEQGKEVNCAQFSRSKKRVKKQVKEVRDNRFVHIGIRASY